MRGIDDIRLQVGLSDLGDVLTKSGAIPTLYLLDKSKIVLLKDATAEQIETYLWNNVLKK